MAQFRGTIKNLYKAGEVSRLGNKKDGLVAKINGWKCGITVICTHQLGKDTFDVLVTPGSTPGGRDVLMARVTDTPNGADVNIIMKNTVGM